MTQPGGHGNDINLAALWVPVMPETSRMGEEMRKAGTDAKRQWEQGFNSGTSPETLGQSFGSKLAGSIGKEFKNFELPYGMSGLLDKFSGDVDEKVVRKLRGQASEALKTYRQEWENLTAAQNRATEAQSKLDVAQQNGVNKASIILPLISEQTAAQKNLTEAHTRATAALDNYKTSSGQLSEELSKAADGGKILAGIMGGAVVLGAQMAVHAVESFVETVAEGFEKSIELTVELAKQAVELGEAYEHIGIQIHEFSAAAGEDYRNLEESAQHVFSTLDVAGNDVGKTMGQLSSILDTSGESIAGLVRHVTELQGRYTTLRATDLGSSFLAFKVPAEEADRALASLLQSARGAGQDLGQLASTLSGNVAITLHEAGLNIEQAGKFTADLMAKGEPGRQAMTGMAMAMKEFGKEGLTFTEGMKLTGQTLEELGNTAAGQDLAEKLFGARNWAIAKDAVADYLNIINQAPDAFSATTASTQEFLDQTATLGNKVEEFKHKAMDAFKPFGEAAKNAAVSGLNSISTWFTTNRTQIIGDIERWGDKFIDMLPKIQEFTADAIRIFGDFSAGLLYLFEPVATTLAAAGAGMLALSGHFKEAKDLLVMTANFDPAKISDIANNIADKIQNVHIDTTGIKQDLSDAADAALRLPATAGSSIAQQGSAFNPPNAGIGPGAGGGPILAGPGAGGGGGGGFIGPGAGAANDRLAANRALAQRIFPWPESEWAAFEQLEMHEAGFDNTAKNPGSGAFGMGQFLGHEHDQYASGYSTDPETQLRTMFQYISDRYGTPSAAWAQYYSHPGGQGYYQGGGAILGNVSPHVPGHGGLGSDPGSACPEEPCIPPWELAPGSGPPPWGQRIPGLPYPGDPGWAPGKHYAMGGPSGTDTVPAWLTPGEYVWDTKTVDKFGWLISMLHKGMSFQGGGGVPSGSSDYAASGAGDDLIGVDQQIAFVDRIAKGFGLTLTAGKSGHGTHDIDKGYHDTGEAGDFSNGMQTDQELAFAMYMIEHFGSQLAELIHTDPRLPKLIKDGKLVDPSFYGADTLAGHKDHVHIAVRATQAMSDLSPGNESLSQGIPGLGGVGGPGSIPGGARGYAFPGIPGQYGGGGAYGGQTADEASSTAKAVRDAQQRASDMDYEIKKQQQHIEDLKTQIADVGQRKPGLLPGTTMALTPDEQKAADEKRKGLQQQLDDATHQLTVSQRERADQDQNIADATRKQTESYYKKPGGTSGAGTTKVAGESEFSQLGSSLLGGIGQELGFGDLFGKPPWEWGAVKLLTGAASWAIGTANAWADEIGKGHTGVTGFQPIEGWDQPGGGAGSLLSGLSGSFGINLPKAAMPQSVSSGPNVVPQQPPGPFGPPTGPAPGPVIQGDYMPINVQAGVDPGQILQPVQEQQNANNASLHTFTGGLPQ